MGYKWFEQSAERLAQTRVAEAGDDLEEGLVCRQARQDGWDLGIGVGSDGVEFAHHDLLS
ncbi:hypothetical protein D9M70_277790 [compost metagenome]